MTLKSLQVFLGIDKNISYANIVKKYLNKKLDKTHQNINWLKRPMSKSQINYLKNDVLHLKEIYNLQNKALKKFKKLDFVNEEFNLIYDNIKNNNGINSKFKKKLVHQIYKNRQFYKFLKIREEKSKIKDLPKNWVLKDEDIIKIIKTKKISIIRNNKFFSNNEKRDIIKYLKNIFKIKIKKNNNEIDIRCLEFFRFLISKKYSIDPNLIASKYDLLDYKNIKKKSKWRHKIYFKVYDNIINGKKKFLLKNFKPLSQILH